MVVQWTESGFWKPLRKRPDAVAVITGGASGIGAAVAARLKREGARVAVWDRLPAADADHAESLDLANAEAVQQAADSTAKALGRIDILVASAGITG